MGETRICPKCGAENDSKYAYCDKCGARMAEEKNDSAGKYEYKVIKTGVDSAQNEMNRYAKQGWRVVAVSPNIAMGMGVVITLEREKTGK